MNRTLEPDDRIARYRVVGPLGAGGMGEVYLAQDQSLERSVALKVLPQELVRHEDRVRRFQQEARSASSLNHPNIVTIYEIGQETVRSGDGDVDKGSVHYISMELVTGKTLAAKIHEEHTDLRTLLGYLAQAAEGISKAHAAGIVHRDLKPSNIMVTDDGFAKVLDFGLAKLMERGGPDSPATTAATAFGERTSEGAVIGTVHYMSPEQVRGKAVDHRADIFALGCILYEAATRQRPFVADSNVETMHKILHDQPISIEELNPDVPAELRRVIRRCLAKSPEQRLQSMKDVAIELREIVEEYDSLSASATSGTATRVAGIPAVTRRRRGPLLPIVAGLGLLVALAAGWWLVQGRNAPPPVQGGDLRMTTQTSRGDVTNAALSPDGRYLAYVAGTTGRSSLRVSQVATGSDVETLPIGNVEIEKPSFSPDGNYVYYLTRKADAPLYRTLFQIPSLGGTPQERAFDVDSRVTFSPDGKQIAFVRGVPQEGRTSLIVRDLELEQERVLASVNKPENITGDPSWSPDGRWIALMTLLPPPPLWRSTITLFDARTGRREDFLTRNNSFLTSLSWLPDGAALVYNGTDLSAGIASGVFMASYPGKQVHRITTDGSSYWSVTTAPDAIGVVRSLTLANLWTADAEREEPPRQMTSVRSPENSPFSFDVSGQGVVFSARRGEEAGIWLVPLTGGEPRRMATGPGHAIFPKGAAGVIAFNRFESGAQHIWSIGTDGANLRQVTRGGGETVLDLSPDGRFMIFATADSARGVWIVSTSGGEPRLLSPVATPLRGAFSPGGDKVLVSTWATDQGFVREAYQMVPVSETGEVIELNVPPQASDVGWGPDEESATYLDGAEPASNVYRVSTTAPTPERITQFSEGRLTGHEWSPDGRRLAVIHQVGVDCNVWVLKGNPRVAKQITNFTGLSVYDVAWTPDSRHVILRAGTESNDAVLIRNFR